MVKNLNIDQMISKWNESNPEKRQLTREALAEKVGCSYSQINNLQSGRIGKGIQIVNSISETLECNIDELINK